jgi:thymidylate synthase ThyX/intein/homing endonuclease
MSLIKASLIYDGAGDPRIPEQMGTPKPGQMEGTTREKTAELAGRVCFDAETEILTRTGWTPFPELPQGVEVGTVNPDTLSLEWQVPDEYIAQEHHGVLYAVDSTKASIRCTPNHKLFAARPGHEDWGLREASELFGEHYRILRHARFDGGVVDPIYMEPLTYGKSTFAGRTGDRTTVITARGAEVIVEVANLPDFATFLGYYIAEGSLNFQKGSGPRVVLYQKDLTPITEAIEALGWKWSEYVDKRNGVRRAVINNSTLANWLRQFGEGSYNKTIPSFVFDWTVPLRERFLDAMMAGDGTVSHYGTRVYNTCSKRLADDVQRLVLMLGRPANINYSPGKDGATDMFRVRETKYVNASINKHKQQDKWVEYSGKVYCVAVPNRVIITRRRDKVLVVGNCYDSLGKGRDSQEYHAHIHETGHYSVYEHTPITIELGLPATGHGEIFASLMNRSGIYVNLPSSHLMRITANFRTMLDWDKFDFGQSYGLKKTSDMMRDTLRHAGHSVAPRIVKAPDSATYPYSIVEPENEHEKWVTLFLTGSRGLCYDSKTEVLTDEGWKFWDDVRGDELFCTLDLQTDEVQYQAASARIREPYVGAMYHVSTEQVDLIVTPNHRMVVQKFDTQAARRGEEPWRIMTAKEVAGRRVSYRKDGVWRGETPDFFVIPSEGYQYEASNQFGGFTSTRVKPAVTVSTKLFAEFLGYWLAEGHLDHQPGSGYGIVLTQNEGPILDRMVQCIREMGFDPCIKLNGRSKTCKRVMFFSHTLYDFLKPHSGSSSKSIPPEIKGWSADHLRLLLDAHMAGGGSVTGRASVGEAYTVSRKLADDLQEIALKAGIAANIRVVDRRHEKTRFNENTGTHFRNNKVCYVVGYLGIRRTTPLVNHNGKVNDGWVEYVGDIHCVTVPNGTLYVRRNGKPVWSGNSHEQVRHGDSTAISQRSTRYVDESSSSWVIHPLLGSYFEDGPHAFDLSQEMAAAETKCKDAYDRVVRVLQEWLQKKNPNLDKTSSRKQARGAARGWLGNALYTEMVFSASVAQWHWMLSQRASVFADAEIRLLYAGEKDSVITALKSSRYAPEFASYKRIPSGDGIGHALIRG